MSPSQAKPSGKGSFFSGVWNEPLNATSRTADRLGHIDFGSVIPPLRAFFLCALCPYLCYPIGALSAYGFLRCCQTLQWPSYSKREKYAGHVMYGVQKRVYDDCRQRLVESQVSDVAEMQHALEVVDDVRHQFVDDPSKKGTAYSVVEQQVMKVEAVFTGENWAWAFIADSSRYLSPIAIAYVFHPSCKRLTVDLRLWLQGRLYYKMVRHPLANFFKTYAEFNSSLSRVNVTKPAKTKAWNRNL